MANSGYTGAKTERKLLGPAAYRTSDMSDSFVAEELCAELWENVDLPHDYIIEGDTKRRISAGAWISKI